MHMKNYTLSKIMALTVVCAFGIGGPISAFALGTVPPLGSAASFSILASLSMSSANITTISSDLGLSPGVASSKTGTWVHTAGSDYFGTGGLSATAKADALTAYNNLVAQTSSGVWSTDPVGGINAPEPGVWTETGSPAYSGALVLTGNATDVWVFKISTDFTFNGSVTLGGTASACNVFWAVAGDATLTTATPFVGTLIASNNITSATNATINGRLISLNGYIHMDGASGSISGCANGTVAPVAAGGAYQGTINVVKTVINDNGGTKKVVDFPLFVNGTPVVSGDTNTFTAPAGVYSITETSNANYKQTFSGDCGINGQISLVPGDNKFCIITNDDIGAPAVVPVVPPLMDMIKTANPLSLPLGAGSVEYTYMLRNTGTVPITDITIVGDTCKPIVLVSGDTNNDKKLDVNEVWVNRCTTNLTATHTNTAVATGWANGISATDIASATVVVGAPIVPPLIHVTKIPSPLTLPIGGGKVTYAYTVTNPGTVPLSNVFITDDKCTGLPGRVIGHPGDINNNNLLESNEAWSFTCVSNLTQSTTNIATVSGSANGLTAKDFAIATVIVAGFVPGLPNTGFAPFGGVAPWGMLLFSIFTVFAIVLFTVSFKKRYH